jgi:citrate synthase
VTGKDKMLDTAIALHEHAMKDEYFQSRNLYPVSQISFFLLLLVI